MSGFVEKIFDSLTDSNKHDSNNQYDQQQQQSYGYNNSGPQQNYSQQHQQQPQVPYPWVARWDDREQRYFYINEQTGERSWAPPGQGHGYGGGVGEGYQQQQQVYGSQQQQGGYYGGGEQREEKKRNGHGSAAAWGLGGAAVGVAAGAFAMHEGEEMSESFSRRCISCEVFFFFFRVD